LRHPSSFPTRRSSDLPEASSGCARVRCRARSLARPVCGPVRGTVAGPVRGARRGCGTGCDASPVRKAAHARGSRLRGKGAGHLARSAGCDPRQAGRDLLRCLPALGSQRGQRAVGGLRDRDLAVGPGSGQSAAHRWHATGADRSLDADARGSVRGDRGGSRARARVGQSRAVHPGPCRGGSVAGRSHTRSGDCPDRGSVRGELGLSPGRARYAGRRADDDPRQPGRFRRRDLLGARRNRGHDRGGGSAPVRGASKRYPERDADHAPARGGNGPVNVNIVTERGDWILNRCARELAERLPNVTVNGTGDVTYYMPAYSWCKPAQIRPGSIGFWTHPTEARLDAYHDRFVANVAMNVTVAAQLAERGAHVTVIRPGVSVPTRRITFGVVGRTYASKRKGEDKIAALVGDGHSVIARGEGWPCPAMPLVLDELPAFYRSIDYLLVTSTEEGGPMPVLDAIAQGVPVIAPNV